MNPGNRNKHNPFFKRKGKKGEGMRENAIKNMKNKTAKGKHSVEMDN